MTKYYLDACIWLNLLNKEQTKVQGLAVWKLTELFLKQYEGKIIISNYVIREIVDKVLDKNTMIILEKYLLSTWKKEEIYPLAREIESKEGYNISFYDTIHVCIAIKENYTLVTRDEKLLSIAKKYITAIKPEEIIY